MYSTAYNLWTFTWFVHFELPFRLKGTKKIIPGDSLNSPLIYILFSLDNWLSIPSDYNQRQKPKYIIQFILFKEFQVVIKTSFWVGIPVGKCWLSDPAELSKYIRSTTSGCRLEEWKKVKKKLNCEQLPY